MPLVSGDIWDLWSCRAQLILMLTSLLLQELISQAGLDPGLVASHDERRRQYSEVSLQEELLEKGWCTLVPQLLEATEHDHREKVGCFRCCRE